VGTNNPRQAMIPTNDSRAPSIISAEGDPEVE